jgi:hypothetical protein
MTPAGTCGSQHRPDVGRGPVAYPRGVPDWPTLPEALLARQHLDEHAYDAHLAAAAAQLAGARSFGPAAVAHALGYPWERPARSYVFADGRVELVDDAALGALREQRTPILAFGSNAAPAVLRRKLAHFPAEEDRRVLVAAGHLHDFDVAAAAQPTVYGALPATLLPSPGTRVRAALLWVTPAQLEQLAWSEMSYRLGRLETRFAADQPELDSASPLAFVSRFGAFAPAGEPAALAAIPAQGRRAPALSQEALLDAAAALALGDQARAADLVRAVYADLGALLPRLRETVRRAALPFASERWTPHPG